MTKTVCGLCDKKIKEGIVGEMTINVGSLEGKTDEKNFLKIYVHESCRNNLFDEIATAGEKRKREIDKDLISKAKSYIRADI